MKYILLVVLINFLFGFFLFIPKTQASTIILDQTCSGSFTCSYYCAPCSWSDSGGTCQLSERGDTDPDYGICQCATCTESRSCTTVGSDCSIQDFGCNAGTSGYAGCTFGTAAYCGDGSCNGAETCRTCSGDCGSCPASCGDSVCNGSETCSNCSNDCGACAGSYTCNGTCRSVISNCGEFAEDLGSGTCAPGLTCCKTRGGNSQDDNCCYDGTWASQNAGGNCDIDPEWTAGWYACNRDHACARCYCAPSCTPQCGQADGCGSTCSNAANGVPGAVTFSSPSSNRAVMADNGNLTLTWSASTKAEYYQYQIYPQGTDCTNTYSHCGNNVGNANTSVTFIPDPNGGNTYTIRVRPVNTTCDSDVGSWYTSDFTIFANLNVNFYLDNNDQASVVGSICQLDGATGTSPGTGAAISGVGQSGSYSGTFPTSTTGRVQLPFWPSPADNSVTLTPGTFGAGQPYICTCPDTCSYAGLGSPQSGINIFLAQVDITHSSWYQSASGFVYAAQDTNAISDPIPVTTCDASATCVPDIITKDLAATDDSAGFAITGGGSIDSSDEVGLQTGYITERTTQAFAVGTTNTKIKENYDYFYREFSMGVSPTSDFATPLDAQKPTVVPADGKRAYFNSGNLTIQSTWAVAANESFVIFVNGNLTITDPGDAQQLITVAPGGFLAFIVSGDINVDSSVGNNTLTSTATNIEGVYIANGNINIQSKGAAAGGDDRFVGAGTFVGWTSVNLDRDFDDGSVRKAENNTKPVELFIFRPDFVQNTPERMTRSRYIWQETN